jgi:hypothetical protein
MNAILEGETGGVRPVLTPRPPRAHSLPRMTRSRGIGLYVLAVLVSSLPIVASGQTPGGSPVQGPSPAPSAKRAPGPSALTIATEPKLAFLTLWGGSSAITGRAPIDVPSSLNGRYRIVVEGAGFSKVQGDIFIPPRGALPYVASEPRGASAALILRGFHYPGVPDLLSGHSGRGIALATAATGALLMAAASHSTYRHRLDGTGGEAFDHAMEARRFRDAWVVYGATVLGASAVDYWIRPRVGLLEATPTRLTLDAPKVSRGGAVWRSLLLPGAGQEFGNHRARGAIWLGAVLLSGAGIVVADNRVQRDQTDLKWANIELGTAAPPEQAQRQLRVDEARRALQASDDVRRGFVTATVSLHILNLLDTVVMPLTVSTATAAKGSSSITPLVGPDEVGMAVAVRF